MSETNSQSQRRQFRVHPHILLTLVREQGGTLQQALCELVMNSVDAGATRIDIEIDKGSGRFCVSDDGRGFSNVEEIENFFETFGTPHDDGDALYGRFRIGRGQIMSYARTVWRSGQFEMRVDLEGGHSAGGGAGAGSCYELVQCSDVAPGCKITGNFYPRRYTASFEDRDIFEGLEFRLKFMPVPVFLNGRQISHAPDKQRWDHEDEFARYRFSTSTHQGLEIYNNGVFVFTLSPERHGCSGVIVSKQALRTNLARNAVIEDRCEVWQGIQKYLRERLEKRWSRASKLKPEEAANLIERLVFGEAPTRMEAASICKVRFIVDVFGEMRTPHEMFFGKALTLFDGQHRMIAERVQREGRVSVFTGEVFERVRLRGRGHDALACRAAVNQMRNALGFAGEPCWHEFAGLVKSYRDTSSFVEDSQLTENEQIVLGALRLVNKRFISTFLAPRTRSDPGNKGAGWYGELHRRREIVAGQSDTMSAWTDGVTYVAVNRRALSWARDHGATQLILLLVHEYCHEERSVGEHVHDHAFFERYHDRSLSLEVGKAAEALFRHIAAKTCGANVIPSSAQSYHIRQLANLAPRFASRRSLGNAPRAQGRTGSAT